jgi:hypothetical protein
MSPTILPRLLLIIDGHLLKLQTEITQCDGCHRTLRQKKLMTVLRDLLTLAACATGIAIPAIGQSHKQTCPVIPTFVDVNYYHQGGRSKPQLRVQMENGAGKPVASVTLTLSLLDTAGATRIYPNDFSYDKGLETGRNKLYAWNLSPDLVDMHRTGESVFIKEVTFADGNEWSDDGSESCQITLDYHAR